MKGMIANGEKGTTDLIVAIVVLQLPDVETSSAIILEK
jgi:hypothetical protein